MDLTKVVTVTITAPSGPGLTITAGVIPNVYEIDYNYVEGIVQLYILGNPNPLQFSLSGVTGVVTNVGAKTVVIS